MRSHIFALLASTAAIGAPCACASFSSDEVTDVEPNEDAGEPPATGSDAGGSDAAEAGGAAIVALETMEGSSFCSDASPWRSQRLQRRPVMPGFESPTACELCALAGADGELQRSDLPATRAAVAFRLQAIAGDAAGTRAPARVTLEYRLADADYASLPETVILPLEVSTATWRELRIATAPGVSYASATAFISLPAGTCVRIDDLAIGEQ